MLIYPGRIKFKEVLIHYIIENFIQNKLYTGKLCKI